MFYLLFTLLSHKNKNQLSGLNPVYYFCVTPKGKHEIDEVKTTRPSVTEVKRYRVNMRDYCTCQVLLP